VTPELALAGYLPRDLLLSSGFVRRCWDVLDGLARDAAALPPVLVGLPEPNPSTEGRPLFNSAALLHSGHVVNRFRKSLLPTYDVFDEDRYFEPFHGPQVLDLGGRRLGISICEDIWNDRDFWKRRRYHRDPIEELARAGADTIVNLSASPFSAGKQHLREEMLGSQRAPASRRRVIYVNQVGSNDDLVFDGRSCAFDAGRTVRAWTLVRTRRRAVRPQPPAPIGPPDPGAESEIGTRSCSAPRLRAQVRVLALSSDSSGGIDSYLPWRSRSRRSAPPTCSAC
jgi:NAD+ synthase/NAD+ synthase (glutamine-hydrolysing)